MHQDRTAFLILVPNLGHFCSVDFCLAGDTYQGLDFRTKFCLLIDQLKKVRIMVNRRIWNVLEDPVELMCDLPLGPVPKLDGTTDINYLFFNN